MSYALKEMFLTLQGEGALVGRRAVFCRFAGCNLWSGLERDRLTAKCSFCDTDFIGTNGPGGGRFQSASDLADAILHIWGPEPGFRFVVFTGGEPLLQLDKSLIRAVKAHNFHIAVETNGTLVAPDGIDWLCVSPKSTQTIVQTSGNELKLVFPQADALPDNFIQLSFERFSLQPMDGPDVVQHTQAALRYCLEHPQWRLSLQTHKILGIA